MGVTEAVVGGLGLASVASGIMGANASEEAAKNTGRATSAVRANAPLASKLNELLTSYGERGLEFAQGQLDTWESLFGPIERNITDYYSGLDPLKFATMYKQDYATQLDQQLKQVTDTLSQRGLLTSGQRAQMLKEAAFSKAGESARIDLQAPELVNQMKTGFYTSVAQPQKINAISGVTSAMDTQAKYADIGANAEMQVNRDLAGAFSNAAAQSSQSAAGWGSTAGTLAGGALALGLGSPVSTPSTVLPSLGFGGNFTPAG